VKHGPPHRAEIQGCPDWATSSATADSSAIDEIGFVDLMPGSGHGPGGWADVAQIELYANAKDRQ
jgi:hypothetical protein